MVVSAVYRNNVNDTMSIKWHDSYWLAYTLSLFFFYGPTTLSPCLWSIQYVIIMLTLWSLLQAQGIFWESHEPKTRRSTLLLPTFKRNIRFNKCSLECINNALIMAHDKGWQLLFSSKAFKPSGILMIHYISRESLGTATGNKLTYHKQELQ